MQILRYTITPLTAFGTPLAGDTLFGQLCWVLHHAKGNSWLTERLAGYTENRPFLVVSDAFPQGFLPLPTVPSGFWTADETVDHKILKKKRWLPLEKMEADFRDWQSLAYNDTKTADAILRQSGAPLDKVSLQKTEPQSHNSISRATGTTGEDMFAPYSLAQIWFHPAMRLDLYAVIDEARIATEDLTAALISMGQSGYGANASVGLGKFTVKRDDTFSGFSLAPNPNAFLTLAPCAPQGLGFDAAKSFYQPLTRFGRHGDTAVLSGNPFKRPLLFAKTGAVFSPLNKPADPHGFIGQGLAGVSVTQPEAVAQGYAPVIGIFMEDGR